MRPLSNEKLIIKLGNAANMRVMSTDTLDGMKRIDADLDERLKQVQAGLISADEAITLTKKVKS